MPRLTKTFRYTFQQKTESSQAGNNFDVRHQRPPARGPGVIMTSQKRCPAVLKIWRACSHGSGGPRAGEETRLGRVSNPSIRSLCFFLIAFTCQVEYRTKAASTRSAGRVNGASVVWVFFTWKLRSGVSRLTDRGNQISAPKPAKHTAEQHGCQPLGAWRVISTTSPPTRRCNWRCWRQIG